MRRRRSTTSKKATIENKGVLNNRISTLIFEYLNKQGIKTHYVKTLNDRDQLCRRVRIIPLEVIVRNVIAGSMAQRLGIEEGTKPSNVIFDICYKNDEFGRSADQRSSCGGAGCRNLRRAETDLCHDRPDQRGAQGRFSPR